MDRLEEQTVLVVCEDELRAREILEKLFAHGVDVIGPASRAGMALALAAQSAPTLALIAQSPTGRRNAEQLAVELFSTWGVRSLVLPAAQSGASLDVEPAPWTPLDDHVTSLRAALDGQGAAALAG
jgi:hypothetical protein